LTGVEKTFARAGEPMLRPLFYVFENDSRTLADSDDFMLGPNLLVASVVEAGQRERPVYLPADPGEWLDFWTGRRLVAGRVHTAPAPIERIPLFVPAGAMIPTTDSTDTARLHDEPSRALRIFPGRSRGTSTFTQYEDDGLSHRYREGDFAQLECTLEWSERDLRVHARRNGSFQLPYGALRVVPPPGETRRLRVSGDGVELRADAPRRSRRRR